MIISLIAAKLNVVVKELNMGRIGRVACLFVLLSAMGSVAKAGDFTCATNDPDTNTVTIIGYTGPGGAVEIPSIIDGKIVNCIGTNAFDHCES